MLIALMVAVNMILKSSSDMNIIQQPLSRPGNNKGSRVSFDMFRFNALMHDFKSSAADAALEPARAPFEKRIETKHHVSEDIKSGTETHHKKPETLESRHAEKLERKPDDSKISKKEPASGRVNDDTVRIADEKAADQTDSTSEIAADDTSRCMDVQNKSDECPEDVPGTQEVDTPGYRIGQYLSALLSADSGELIDDNLLNAGKGSPVGDVASSGNKSNPGIYLETGNLLSQLIHEELSGSEPGNGKPDAKGDVNAESLISEMDALPFGTDEADTDEKNLKAVNRPIGGETGVLSDIFKGGAIEDGAEVSESGIESKLMQAGIKGVSGHSGESGEATGERDVQDGKKSDELVKDTASDKKSEIRHDHIGKDLYRLTESALKDMKNNENAVGDRAPLPAQESIQLAAAARVSTDTSSRTEGVRTENGNSATMGNPNSSHESIKTGETPKVGNMLRPSAFSEVVEKITYIVKGNTKLDVKVQSEALGKLNINVSIEKGLVNVQIHSADKAVREFVENNMQQIVDSLSKNGVSIGGFSVGARHHDNNEGSGSLRDGGRGNSYSAGRSKGREYIGRASNISYGNGLVSIFA